jgi:NADPH-dependent 2,4-dienoyl-CoA reductase/sulfur reductase-like enzyme
LSVPVLVLGNGAGAWHAVRGLRESGYRGDVHLLSDHGEPAYNPMLLAYYVRGAIPRERCFPFGDALDMYAGRGITFHGADPVVALDPSNQIVGTEGGARFRYDACVVATGASPIALSVSGAGSSRIHHLRTLEQADRLMRALQGSARRVLVAGASMVGMKVVEAMIHRGLEVVLCEASPQVLPLAAHPDCAALVADGLAEHGVELLLGSQVEAFEEMEAGVRAYVGATVDGPKNGLEADESLAVDVDLVVVAVGVRSNLGFVDPAEVAVDSGLLVDQYGRAECEGLYAAGDCAQTYDPTAGRHTIIGSWAAACYQGRAVGRNIARALDGRMRPLDAAPTVPAHNVIHFLDWVFVSIGDVRQVVDASGPAQVCDPEEGLYYRLTVQDGRVAGVNFLNCCDGAGILRYAAARDRVGGGQGADLHMEWPRFIENMRRTGAAGLSGAA